MQSALEFDRYTVAWIAPLEIEAKAARSMLDNEHNGKFKSKRGDRYIYTAGNINGHNVVIATFPAGHPYGTNSATALISDLKEKFRNIWFGLLVGVAAGLPNSNCDIRLGDVIVALDVGSPAIINYELGKETLDGFQLLQQGALPRTEDIVSSAIGLIKAEASDFSKYYTAAIERNNLFADPGRAKDCFYEGNSLLEREPRSERTKVWYGSIGSGDKLLKNPEKRNEIREKYNIIGLEMEAAGIMNILPVGIIRGVSDYGDSHKNKEWQPYAAITAAAYAKRVLYEIQPENSSEKRTEAVKKQEREDCLISLSFSNIDDRHNTIALAHENTCNWLFSTSEFQEWRNRTNLPSNNGVLWIKGKPGSGKSTLMKHTLNHCKKFWSVTVAYFFNARGSELEQTPLGMMRSLVFQLVDRFPAIFDRFYPLYQNKRKKHGNGWEWHIGELKEFLLSEMRASQPKRMLILIDALDECTEKEVRDVVKFIEQLSVMGLKSGNAVDICLSSRHYPTISMTKCLSLELEVQYGHDRDISWYIASNLRTSDQAIREELLQKSDHVFMWVVLVVEMLNIAFDEGRERAMRKKLDEVPGDLEEVYRILLEKDNPHKQETLLLLQWVLFAQELLRPEQLYFAVLAGTYPEEVGPWKWSKEGIGTIRRYITSTSRGLVESRRSGKENVQFIHYSVNDFLLRNKRFSQLDPKLQGKTVAKCHSRLAACCMAYIKSAGFATVTLLEDFPFSKYASNYILHHAENAQSDNIHQDAVVCWLQQPDTMMNQFLEFRARLGITNLSYSNYVELLYVCSVYGHEALVDCCLRNGANIDAQRGHGTALHAASRQCHFDAVKVLVGRGVNVNAQGGEYGTALQAASIDGNLDVLKFLLDKGADVNAQGGYYGTALKAASRMGRFDVVNLLVDRGADVNTQGGYYGTALQAASIDGNLDVVKFLVDRGADVNAQGGEYGTALQAASIDGNLDVVKLLVNSGADINAKGGHYDTALNAARRQGGFNQSKLLKYLREAGAKN